MKDILPLSSEDFGLFQKLLIETSGHNFEESRKQTLHQALWQRLQYRGYDSYEQYYNLLKYHPEGYFEIRELLDLITIGETYFFRNKAQFDVLMKFVLPEIVQRKERSWDKCFRAWSAGCSRGDEAYSIVMALMEVLPSYKEWSLCILGTDINRNGLACSKEAIYGEKDISHLPKEYLSKYFNIQGSSYILNPEVRELVQFEYHNLAKDPFMHEKMQNLDIIFCRNVTIYFDPQTTRRVIDNFYNCLCQEGYLFLGHAETLWQITNTFESVEFPQSFIYRKRLNPVQADAGKPFIAIPEINLENMIPSLPPPTTLYQNDSRSVPKQKGSEPATSLSRFESKPKDREDEGSTLDNPQPPLFESNPNEDHQSSCLTQAIHLANEAKYKEAADILKKIIEENNLSVEAYYLLGVLSYKNSDFKESEDQFRKVIYINPDSILAYFNLGNIYLYQRRYREATREFSNAIWWLEKRPKDEEIKFCEDITVEFLLRACRNNLAMISKRGE
jgi:chemotaxis protein methyltransferase CheR